MEYSNLRDAVFLGALIVPITMLGIGLYQGVKIIKEKRGARKRLQEIANEDFSMLYDSELQSKEKEIKNLYGILDPKRKCKKIKNVVLYNEVCDKMEQHKTSIWQGQKERPKEFRMLH